MAEEWERRIRPRLLALEQAIAVRPDTALHYRSERISTRWRGPAGGVVVAMGAVLLVAMAVGLWGGRGGNAPSASQPLGGLTRDQAVSKAQAELTGGVVQIEGLRTAESGPFATLATSKVATAVTPDRWVWAVTFDATATVCAPDGSACWTTRPGTITLYLDFFTGEELASAASYSSGP